jgi:hypothetical protein
VLDGDAGIGQSALVPKPWGTSQLRCDVQLRMRVVGLLLLVAATTVACGSSPEATPARNVIVVPAASNPAVSTAATPQGNQSDTSPPPMTADTASGVDSATGAPQAPSPSPNLGQFTDQAALIAALVASGPLDNQLPENTAGGLASRSICADIAQFNDPSAGQVVHQAIATLNGQTGVVLVFAGPDGEREVRMYGTGDADPATGGCPLWFQAPLD